MKDLLNVITELKAPKGQRNNFGNYNYRSCEDILEAVKPLLLKYGLMMSINDDIVAVLNRVYVKATVTVWTDKESKQVSAYAREAETKKGMDESQITGAASSYARKYALNGMFLIDDTKDADSQDNSKHAQPQGASSGYAQKKPEIDKPKTKSEIFASLVKKIKTSNFDDNTMAQLQERYASVQTQEQGSALEAEVDKLLNIQKKFVDDPVDARELI